MKRAVPPDRVACCVPGCGRTFKRQGDWTDEELMCGRHYRLADRTLRLRARRIRKLGRKLRWPERLVDLEWRMWSRIKRQANERALGISA